MEPREYPTCVKRAILILDEFDPGWWRSIRPSRLDLRSGTECVLGQRFGHFMTGVYSLIDRGALLQANDTGFVNDLLFILGRSRNPYDAFFDTRRHAPAWIAEVRRRNLAELNALVPQAVSHS